MPYYQHSGRAPLVGVACGLAAGIAAGALLAAMYAYLILYIPFISLLSFLLSAGLGVLTGMAASAALHAGRVRSDRVATLAGFVGGLVALYVSWVVWTFALLRRADVDISLLALLAPGTLRAVIQQVNEVGGWSLKGFTPTGTVLWILWALEALLIVGAATLVAAAGLAGMFCERCDAWCEESPRVAKVAFGDDGWLKDRLESGHWAVLEELGAPSVKATQWYSLDLSSCPRCRSLHALSVNVVTVSVNSKNEKSEGTSRVVDKLLVDSTAADYVRALAPRLVVRTAAS